MELVEFELSGLKLIKPKVFRDQRGFFLETFSRKIYKDLGIDESFAQDNHSFSEYGCIRGMHFQTSPGQAKLVRVAEGRIFDVAVDIRPHSPTFGKWTGVILDGQEHHQLFVPIGFAHGFCVISSKAHVLYKVSTPYNSKTEAGFRWNDPQINIAWPVEHPIVSERDQESPYFKELQL